MMPVETVRIIKCVSLQNDEVFGLETTLEQETCIIL